MLRECIQSRTELSQKGHPKDSHILAFAQYELATILVESPEVKFDIQTLFKLIAYIYRPKMRVKGFYSRLYK